MKIKDLGISRWLLAILFPLVMVSCKKGSADPCDGTTCLNDGYCADGNCVCPEGYGGADCSQQITPKKIQITGIELTRFPATNNNGAGWDTKNGPDLYIKLFKGDEQIWQSSDTYNYQNATPSEVYTFEVMPAVDLTDPENEYTIMLYDQDDYNADDLMGEIIFTPYSGSKGFPKVLTLDTEGAVAFKLNVSYTW
ncbi:MAG: hypothetical protein KF862_12835 [Chitinophagaceae bacterium]|nr:hypothetical protein [Chitinophagaceae bacterium]